MPERRAPSTHSAVYLLRHADAGDREAWSAPDLQRPLSGRGRRQAVQIASQLAPLQANRLISSPHARCVQTLEPLARALARRVEVDERLAEGADSTALLALLDEVPSGSVLCSHGDLIPAVIGQLERAGLQVRGAPDHRKGACWVLERVRGKFRHAHALPPPDRTARAA